MVNRLKDLVTVSLNTLEALISTEKKFVFRQICSNLELLYASLVMNWQHYFIYITGISQFGIFEMKSHNISSMAQLL